MEIIHPDTLTWGLAALAVVFGLIFGGTNWFLTKFATRPWNGFWLSNLVSALVLVGIMWLAHKLGYRF